MNKDLSNTARNHEDGRADHLAVEQIASGYQPALDAYARKLIARIKRDHLDTDAVLALQAHYEAHSDHPSLANLMEGWAQTLRDDRKASEAFVQAAEAVLAGLQDRARAQALYMRALARFPEQPLALAKLETLLAESGDYTELERCLTFVARDLERRNADPNLRADVHYRLGQLYEWRLLLLGRAIAHYKSALDLDPAFVPAIAAARGIYLRSAKAQAAADMYELQIVATTETWQRHGLLLALAKHRREVMSDIDGAVRALRRALKEVPADPSATELLADALRERAERGQGPAAHTDRVRSAELYYQLASEAAPAEAPKFLTLCLALHSGHERALRLQAEINTDIPQTHSADRHMDNDLAAWLDDKEVTLLAESVTTGNMVPITDRPPPPPKPGRRARTRRQWQV
jgi:tetratricopeptide (TPR) repeat protein